jgi:hypothetical protein
MHDTLNSNRMREYELDWSGSGLEQCSLGGGVFFDNLLHLCVCVCILLDCGFIDSAFEKEITVAAADGNDLYVFLY